MLGFALLLALAKLQICCAQIYWMGKPDPVIYDVALDMLKIPKERILAVGDSLQHDIQGWAYDLTASAGLHAPGVILHDNGQLLS